MNGERASKRQRELLTFVDSFIQGHGYGPSYREIMRALGYKSVSTVAIHLNGLIAKGYVRKRDNSARSLEVLQTTLPTAATQKAPTAAQEKWLVGAIAARFAALENQFDEKVLDELYVLVGALKVLGLEEAHISMKARLTDYLKKSKTA